MSYYSLGIANLLNCASHDALEALEQALAIGRERRLQIWEGSVLGTMAAARLGLGDRVKALAVAEESIAVGRQRGSRIGEFSALLTRIRALRETRGLEATPPSPVTSLSRLSSVVRHSRVRCCSRGTGLKD